MNDLISRSALIEAFDQIGWYSFYNGYLVNGAMCDENGLYKAVDIFTAIDNAPAVEAVPVVRCGECERRAKSADLTFTVYCPWFGQRMDKTDFCSYGERRNGDATG